MSVSPKPRIAGRRIRAIARVSGAILGMLLGILYGLYIVQSRALGGTAAQWRPEVLGIGVAGAASMALAAPRLCVDPFLWLQDTLENASAPELIGGMVGLFFSLMVAAMISVLLGPLPWGTGFFISVGVGCGLIYIGVQTGTKRQDVFVDFFRAFGGRGQMYSLGTPPSEGRPIVVDTSALIDGRIVDIAKTGFLQGHLLLAHFVLEEVQSVADSADPIRRARGRRGLDVADDLHHGGYIACEIVDAEYPGVSEVDVMLLRLCRDRNADLLTQDYNLNRLAATDGIHVLNMNDLANAVKGAVTTGEVIDVLVTKVGREPHQGVGYLGDGTMVVIEGGSGFVDSSIRAHVSSVLQTSSGRMIFASVVGMAAAPARLTSSSAATTSDTSETGHDKEGPSLLPEPPPVSPPTKGAPRRRSPPPS